MKKLLLHSALFILPIIIGVLFLPIDSRLKYLGLKQSCFYQSIWVHDRIFENPDPVDVVFLGTSRSINGIDDKYICDSLGFTGISNFGYCKAGRNLHYTLLKEILQTKSPKHVILEVREDEERYSHNTFPLIATPSDVFFPQLLFNRDVAIDIWEHLLYRVEMTQDRMFSMVDTTSLNTGNFGYAAKYDTIKPDQLEIAMRRKSKEAKSLSEFDISFHAAYPRSYIKRIADICREKNIRLTFFYLPGLYSPYEEPKHMEYYESLGEVWVTPRDLVEDKNLWYDAAHFNHAGAHKLGKWLAGKLRDKQF